MKIKFLAICYKGNNVNESLENILTIVKNNKQVDEYLLNKLHLDYLQHFNAWCELHNEDKDSVETFKKYMSIVYNNEPYYDYVIIPLSYNKDTLCSLIRILAGFYPVGASYELDEELTNMVTINKEENEDENNETTGIVC